MNFVTEELALGDIARIMKNGERVKRFLFDNGHLAVVIRLAEVIVAIEWAMAVVAAFQSNYGVVGHNAVIYLVAFALGIVGFLLSTIIGGFGPQYRKLAYGLLFGSWTGLISLMLIGALMPG